MAKLGSNTRLGQVTTKSGHVRAAVTNPKQGDPALQFEYRSVQPTSSGPDDSCTVNLRTNKLV